MQFIDKDTAENIQTCIRKLEELQQANNDVARLARGCANPGDQVFLQEAETTAYHCMLEVQTILDRLSRKKILVTLDREA